MCIVQKEPSNKTPTTTDLLNHRIPNHSAGFMHRFSIYERFVAYLCTVYNECTATSILQAELGIRDNCRDNLKRF